MSRRALLLILVALLVVLAGCNGLGGDSSPPDRDVYDVDDPVQSSLDETGDELSDGELVPGLTADGIEDPTALSGAHRGVLENTTFSTEERAYGQNSTSSVMIERTSMENQSANRLYQIEEF